MKNPELVRRVRDHAKRLDRIFDEDPNAAIEAARALLAGEELDAANRAGLAGGILIDAGSHVKDKAAVQQETALFRDLHARVATAATAYNLANGIHASATLSGEPYGSPTQCRMRQEARSLYSEAAADEGHRSRALTNLANLLRLSHRRLEAYDAYASALEADPQNAIASSGIASVLSEIADFRLGPETLHGLAARYLAQTNANDAAIAHYAGRHAVQNIRKLVKQARAKPSRRRKRPRGYAGFVWEHRLALSYAMEMFNPARRFWDDLASDLTGDGYLSSHRLLRHTGTHRFVVLHDMLPHTPRPSPFIEHHRQFDFERTTVKTLQMCRAALTYAREMVLWRERRSSAEGKLRAPMYAPPHHEVRGLKPRMRKR